MSVFLATELELRKRPSASKTPFHLGLSSVNHSVIAVASLGDCDGPTLTSTTVQLGQGTPVQSTTNRHIRRHQLVPCYEVTNWTTPAEIPAASEIVSCATSEWHALRVKTLDEEASCAVSNLLRLPR